MILKSERTHKAHIEACNPRRGPRPTSHPNKKARQQAALDRQVLRRERIDIDQLRKLEERGHGHCAEAERLRKLTNSGSYPMDTYI